jgi:hypothetical protein
MAFGARHDARPRILLGAIDGYHATIGDIPIEIQANRTDVRVSKGDFCTITPQGSPAGEFPLAA